MVAIRSARLVKVTAATLKICQQPPPRWYLSLPTLRSYPRRHRAVPGRNTAPRRCLARANPFHYTVPPFIPQGYSRPSVPPPSPACFVRQVASGQAAISLKASSWKPAPPDGRPFRRHFPIIPVTRHTLPGPIKQAYSALVTGIYPVFRFRSAPLLAKRNGPADAHHLLAGNRVHPNVSGSTRSAGSSA